MRATASPLCLTHVAIQEIVAFKDSAYLELVLKMLQQMCEGHNLQMQNYLREQPDNLSTIDLVTQSVELLHVMTENIDEKTLPLVVQVRNKLEYEWLCHAFYQTVETLVEFSQGCLANQAAIFDARVMDALNFIIRNHSYKGCKDKLNKVPHDRLLSVVLMCRKVAELKQACVTLITSLLEDDSDPVSHQMAKEIVRCRRVRSALLIDVSQYESLDVAGVQKGLMFYHKAHLNVRPLARRALPDSPLQGEDVQVWAKCDMDPGEEAPAALDVAFEFFHVLYRLQDFVGEVNASDDPDEPPLEGFEQVWRLSHKRNARDVRRADLPRVQIQNQDD